MFDLDTYMKLRLTYALFVAPCLKLNESVAGNQHNLGKFGTVTGHSHGVQWRGLYYGIRGSNCSGHTQLSLFPILT